MIESSLKIGPFRLHPTQGLSLGNREVHVTPKSLAVLSVLATRPGWIVTKQELLENVWGDTIVTDASLSSCIRELRRAMDDDAHHPRFIETVHRRGYRLLANNAGDTGKSRTPAPAPSDGGWQCASGEAPLDWLDELASQARDGEMAVAVIGGPTGSGKSSLVARSLDRQMATGHVQACRVVCAHPDDAGVAYGPLLNVVEWLKAVPDATIASALRRHGPSWVAELPADSNQGDTHGVLLRVSGATTHWRDMEFISVLGAIAKSTRLVLAIENLQWCDTQSLKWLESFITAGDGIPLLLVLTIDDTWVEREGRHAEQLLALRSAERTRRVDLEPANRNHTRPVIADATGLRKPLRSVIEAGAVAGARFTAAEVAAAVELPVAESAERLERAASQFRCICTSGIDSWPDGTLSAGFTFVDRDERSRWIDGLETASRTRMLKRIAHRLETGWQGRSEDIAPRLGGLYERAAAFGRAVDALLAAGNAARRRGSHAIAIGHFARAEVLLESLPPAPERNQLMAEVATSLGRELVYTEGLGSRAANEQFSRAYERRLELPETPEGCRVIWRIWVFCVNRGPLARARDVSLELLKFASRIDDPALILQGYHALWATSLMLGEFSSVLSYASLGLRICGSGANGSMPMTTGCTLHDSHLTDHHAAVCAGMFSAWADVVSGNKDAAVRSLDAAVAHSRDVGHPFTLASTLMFSAAAMAAAGDAGLARSRAVEAREVSQRFGFTVPEAWATIYEGWAKAVLSDGTEGLELIEAGLAASASVGLMLFRPFQLSLAASANTAIGRYEAASACLDEAFSVVARTGDRLAIAELHRVRGELAYARSRDPDDLAEAYSDLENAVRIARDQGASLWAKRASESLSRLRGALIVEQPPASRRLQ